MPKKKKKVGQNEQSESYDYSNLGEILPIQDSTATVVLLKQIRDLMRELIRVQGDINVLQKM